jgi:hypothetical protein
MTHALKNKYIVRSRHNTLGTQRFIPVNKFEAQKSVMRPTIYIEADFKDVEKLDPQKSIESLHGSSKFKRTSPVSQDIYRATPEVTLNKDCTYKSFCPPEKTDSRGNPRLAVLENFKEISRIMTNNFISHKKLEQRYHGALPKTE